MLGQGPARRGRWSRCPLSDGNERTSRPCSRRHPGQVGQRNTPLYATGLDIPNLERDSRIQRGRRLRHHAAHPRHIDWEFATSTSGQPGYRHPKPELAPNSRQSSTCTYQSSVIPSRPESSFCYESYVACCVDDGEAGERAPFGGPEVLPIDQLGDDGRSSIRRSGAWWARQCGAGLGHTGGRLSSLSERHRDSPRCARAGWPGAELASCPARSESRAARSGARRSSATRNTRPINSREPPKRRRSRSLCRANHTRNRRQVLDMAL